MILLQISYEVFIAVIATLMSICAVFVTISPLVHNSNKRDLEKLKTIINDRLNEIEELKKRVSTLEEETQPVRNKYRRSKNAIDNSLKQSD